MKNMGLSPSRTIAASQIGQNSKKLYAVKPFGYPINSMNMYKKIGPCKLQFSSVHKTSPAHACCDLYIGVQAMACDLNVMPDWYWCMVWYGIWSDFWHSQELCGLERN